jgi:hypothetical protein
MRKKPVPSPGERDRVRARLHGLAKGNCPNSVAPVPRRDKRERMFWAAWGRRNRSELDPFPKEDIEGWQGSGGGSHSRIISLPASKTPSRSFLIWGRRSGHPAVRQSQYFLVFSRTVQHQLPIVRFHLMVGGFDSQAVAGRNRHHHEVLEFGEILFRVLTKLRLQIPPPHFRGQLLVYPRISSDDVRIAIVGIACVH